MTSDLKMKDLLEEGFSFSMNLNKEDNSDELSDNGADDEYSELLSQYSNKECLLLDEDTYSQGQPFEVLSAKMFNLTNKGEVKKRILREGNPNESPEEFATVRVQYNAYIEYEAEPFDSTYARKRVNEFTLNRGEVIEGLDIGVSSMNLNEKSQFLIVPDFAYGKMGCLGRIPPEATILFEVELIEIINSGKAMSFHSLPEDKQKEFDEIYLYCVALCVRGKDLFGKNIMKAVKEYNGAVAKLESAEPENDEHEQKKNELLLRLYTNLLVCYTNMGEAKNGYNNFKKIKKLAEQSSLIQLNAKVYFQSAKCLKMLDEYDLAMEHLKIAIKMEPKNNLLAVMLTDLVAKKEQYLTENAKIGKAMFKGLSSE